MTLVVWACRWGFLCARGAQTQTSSWVGGLGRLERKVASREAKMAEHWTTLARGIALTRGRPSGCGRLCFATTKTCIMKRHAELTAVRRTAKQSRQPPVDGDVPAPQAQVLVTHSLTAPRQPERQVLPLQLAVPNGPYLSYLVRY